MLIICFIFFFSSRRRHTRWPRDWSSDVCSSDLLSLVDSVPAGFLDARLIERIHAAPRTAAELTDKRSEERRVGKECRSWGMRDELQENYMKQKMTGWFTVRYGRDAVT